MTNAEKFKEVFGHMPCSLTECNDCPFLDTTNGERVCNEEEYWDSEYKESTQTKKQIKKFGHWEKGKYWSEGCGMGESYGYYYKCSECGKVVRGGYDVCGRNFCSGCGAEMR